LTAPDSVKLPSLTQRELNWYAMGSLPGGIGALGWSYLVFYYNQVLGIPASLIGLAALAVSVFDAVTDPVAGAISDRTDSRLGRRHPYLLSAALPSALIFYLVWAPPAGLSLPILMGWLLGLHLISRLVSTFYSVPYLALGAEVSSDYEVRTQIVTLRNIYFHAGRALAGGVLLLVFLRPTLEYPNGQLNPAGYPRFGLVFAIITGLALLLSAWQTRSWIPHLSKARPRTDEGVRGVLSDFREALGYRSFRSVLFGSVSRHIAWGVSDSLGIYMATYFWKVDTTILFIWGCGMFTGLFVGLPFWRRMATRYDKRPICMIGDACYFVFFCLPFLFVLIGFWPARESSFFVPLYVLTTGFLAHFGIAATGTMMGSMLGDVTDQDELESGRRREGLIFGAESFTWKALTGLGPLVAGVVVDLVGLSAEVAPETAPPEVATGLGLAQGGVMTLCFALALFFISRYDLNRARHRTILAGLAERADVAEAAD
jgi:Na+/melibiose symporter-like transporter